MILPCISIQQPYASLVAAGIKSVETRSYAPPARYIGQHIAIHASKGTDHLRALRRTDTECLIRQALSKRHIDYATLPMGQVLCTATLRGAYRIGSIVDDGKSARIIAYAPGSTPIEGSALPVSPFGYYAPGRWCWLLTGASPLRPPVPAKGSLNFFDVNLPQE